MWPFLFAVHTRAARHARGVFYGWWIVGIALFVFTLTSSTTSHGLGTFVVVLERQFGWSRTALSGAFSVARIERAGLGPIAAFLIDRVGSRRMALIGFITMGFSFLLFAFIENLWHFYLAFMAITLGLLLGSNLAAVTAVNNWFIQRRSLALAIALSGFHFGGFLVPLLALAFQSHGFRATTFGIGVFFLLVAVLVPRLIRNRPEEYGLRPDGAPPELPSGGPSPTEASATIETRDEFTARQALRTPAFWFITVAYLSSNIAIATLMVHLLPRLTDLGMSLSMAGLVVATYTAVALPVQFIAGYLADRFPKQPLIFGFLFIQSISMMVIALATNTYWAFLFALLYGIGFGGHLPLMISIRGDYFGRKAFATITALSMLPTNLVMIGAPLFAGFMFDTTNSYFIPFTTFAAFNLIGSFLILLVKRPKTP